MTIIEPTVEGKSNLRHAVALAFDIIPEAVTDVVLEEYPDGSGRLTFTASRSWPVDMMGTAKELALSDKEEW